MEYKLTAQEDLMGCAVACTASLLGKEYSKTLKLFRKSCANTRGYYCKEIIQSLSNAGLHYNYSKVNDQSKKYLKLYGTIVFVKRSRKYPSGHYLLRTNRGWMNPWINYPKINPVKAGFQKKLPGKAQWVLYKQQLLKPVSQ